MYTVLAAHFYGNNDKKYTKKFCQVVQTYRQEIKREKGKPKVGVNLGICILNVLLEVRTLPSLVDISLMKVKIVT